MTIQHFLKSHKATTFCKLNSRQICICIQKSLSLLSGKSHVDFPFFCFPTSQIKTTRLQNCTICLKKACKMTQITWQNDSFHPTTWTISELRMTHIELFLDRNRQAKAKIWKAWIINIVWYFEFFLKRCLFIFLSRKIISCSLL